jgi:hypothetical protein
MMARDRCMGVRGQGLCALMVVPVVVLAACAGPAATAPAPPASVRAAVMPESVLVEWEHDGHHAVGFAVIRLDASVDAVGLVAELALVSGLTQLEWLLVASNGVADLTPVAGLSNLNFLQASDNAITDLSPLVANAGLGEGSIVWLTHNCLDLTPGSSAMTAIEALEARGVVVDATPQKEGC